MAWAEREGERESGTYTDDEADTFSGGSTASDEADGGDGGTKR